MKDIQAHVNITVSQRLTGSIPSEITNDYFITAVEMGLRGFSINYQKLTPQFIKMAHLHLFSVFSWTVQDPTDVVTMYKMGVDGYITNNVQSTRLPYKSIVLTPQ